MDHNGYSLGEFVKFDPQKHSYYVDLRGNQFIGESVPRFNKRFLELGEK